MLHETLDEEGNADKKLTDLAESIINIEAMETADEEESDWGPTTNRSKTTG